MVTCVAVGDLLALTIEQKGVGPMRAGSLMNQSRIVGYDGPASCGNEPASRGAYEGSRKLSDSLERRGRILVKNFIQNSKTLTTTLRRSYSDCAWQPKPEVLGKAYRPERNLSLMPQPNA